ncbi:MAG: sialidase domain-containing protein, partial [Candidatus Gracilibacteria bacterium]|nr:sialidase domain-containing protein [Candidatus Gracilibacteria bacterium]
VCFVIDGGTNLVTSNSGTCTAKYKMSLKDYDSSLVGYWDMETTTGGLLKDLSGNGNNGTGSGGVIIGGTGGRVGNATLFNSGSKDCFEILDSNILDLNGKFTISVIVNFLGNLANGDMEILSKTKGSASAIIFEPYRFGIGYMSGQYISPTTNFIDNGNFYTKGTTISNNDGTNNGFLSIVQSGSYIPYVYERDIFRQSMNYISNQFINITISYNYGINKIYFNGNLLMSYNGINKDIWNSDGSLLIGKRGGTASGIFNGTIDDIKIYNRALSDQEIAQQSKIAGF